jgi:hypothetical protein
MQYPERGSLGELADPAKTARTPRKKNPGSSESQGGGGLQLLPGAIGSPGASCCTSFHWCFQSHRHGQNGIPNDELRQYVLPTFKAVVFR